MFASDVISEVIAKLHINSTSIWGPGVRIPQQQVSHCIVANKLITHEGLKKN